MAGPRPRLSSRGGPVTASRSGDDPTGGEGLDRRGGVDPEEPSDRHAPIGDDDFLTIPDLLEPVTQVGPQLCHCNIHALSVQLKTCNLYAHGGDWGRPAGTTVGRTEFVASSFHRPEAGANPRYHNTLYYHVKDLQRSSKSVGLGRRVWRQ